MKTASYSSVEVVRQILILNTGNAVPVSSIPSKSLKSNSYTFAPALHRILNQDIAQNSFPDKHKEGNITALHRKDDASLKTIYKPITCLPSISKLFERILESQIKNSQMAFSLHTFVVFAIFIALNTPFSDLLNAQKEY